MEVANCFCKGDINQNVYLDTKVKNVHILMRYVVVSYVVARAASGTTHKRVCEYCRDVLHTLVNITRCTRLRSVWILVGFLVLRT